MTSLDCADLDPGRVYKLLSAIVVPRPIAWLGTISADGVPNLAPFSFFQVMSPDPPTVMVSITGRPGGLAKDSQANLEANPGATINLVSHPQWEAMFESSLDHDPDVDEYAVAGLETEPADLVPAFRVKGAPVSLECVRSDHVDGSDVPGTIAVGAYTVNLMRVLRIHVRDDLINDRLHVDLAGLDAIGRISTKFIRVDGIFDPPGPGGQTGPAV